MTSLPIVPPPVLSHCISDMLARGDFGRVSHVAVRRSVELSLHLPAAVCVHDRESGRSHRTPKNEFLAARDLAGHGVMILHRQQKQEPNRSGL